MGSYEHDLVVVSRNDSVLGDAGCVHEASGIRATPIEADTEPGRESGVFQFPLLYRFCLCPIAPAELEATLEQCHGADAWHGPMPQAKLDALRGELAPHQQ